MKPLAFIVLCNPLVWLLQYVDQREKRCFSLNMMAPSQHYSNSTCVCTHRTASNSVQKAAALLSSAATRWTHTDCQVQLSVLELCSKTRPRMELSVGHFTEQGHGEGSKAQPVNRSTKESEIKGSKHDDYNDMKLVLSLQ